MGATKSLLVLQLVMMMGLISTTVGQDDVYGELFILRDFLGDGPYFDNWDPTITYCDWTGITCKDDGATVIDIKVETSYTARAGVIPRNLAKFTALENLHIGNDLPRVSGTIPNDISGLTNLKTLAIIGANLTGQVPAVLGQIPKLARLTLFNNRFTGSIGTLANATNLEYLDVRQNRLSAPQLPAALPPALKTLRLDGNQYQGEITTDIAKAWGGLEEIGLSHNQLGGDPEPLFAAGESSLKVLNIARNKFLFNLSTAVLPTGLKHLDLSQNIIYGTISPQVNDLVSLEHVEY